MSKTVDVVAGIGLDQKTRKSRWPARLDVVQSASGLFLGLFMWGHMVFVSTILISKDAMWWVTRMFEAVCSRRTISRYRLTSVQKICRSPHRSHFLGRKMAAAGWK